MSQTIINEVKLIRAKDKHANIDIKDMVIKHVPIGTPVAKAIDCLKQEGFEVTKGQMSLSDKKEFDETFVGIYKMGGPLSFFGFQDEIRIFLDIKNGIVVNVLGKIIYRAL